MIRELKKTLRRLKHSASVALKQTLLWILNRLRRSGGKLLPESAILGLWRSTRNFSATPEARGVVKLLPVDCDCPTIEFEPPKSPAGALHPAFSTIAYGPFPQWFAASLPNARIVGQTGDIVASNRLVPTDISYEVGGQPEQHSLLSRLRLPRAHHVPSSVFCLSAWGADNYFHWLFDVLPKLAFLEQVGVTPDFYATRQVHGFQSESLRLLGIDEARQIPLSTTSVLICDTVIATSAIERNGDIAAWVISWLREKFIKHPPLAHKRRILVVRREQGRRAWSNQGEALPLLVSIGFEPVLLEEHTFSEQVALFSNAEAVVAPHGAGLANLAFAPGGCKVVELFSPSYVNPCYYKLSAVAGHDYYYLVGKGPKQADPSRPGIYDDITIGPEELRQTLEHAGLMESGVKGPASIHR